MFQARTLIAGLVVLVAIVGITSMTSVFTPGPVTDISPGSQVALVSAPPTSGLVAHYAFDESSGSTAANSVGGSASVSGATWTSGNIGGALSFNGSSNKVDLGSDLVGTGADTVCAWINPRTLGASNYTPSIVSNGTFAFYLFQGSSRYTLGFSSGSRYPSAGSFDLTGWKHVCVSRTSSGSATFYLNGSALGTADSGSPTSGYTNLIVGNNSQGNQGFDGIIDEVRIYSRALNSNEVSAIYNYKGSVTSSTYTLTVNKNDGGVINSTPAGIDCAGTNNCTQTVPAGSQVLLTATPPTGLPIITWGGACSGTATTCTVTVNSNTSVTATFSNKEIQQPDAQVISGVSESNITTSGAKISWSITGGVAPVVSNVKYGFTTEYGSNTSETKGTSQTLSGLKPDTRYHYQIESRDSLNRVVTSADRTFDTLTLSNQPPTVSLIANPTSANAPATINLTASPADSDGTIAKVEFYNGAILLGTDTTSPYSFTWTNVPVGTYNVSAKATDNAGAITSSASTLVTVNAAPSIGKFDIGDKVKVNTTAVAVRDVPSSELQSTRFGIQPKNATGVVAAKSGFANPTQADGLIWSYITYNQPATSCTKDNVADCYSGWSTELYLDEDTSTGNVPPTVSLSASPTAGIAPLTSTLTATASDSDGNITKVEFYNGTSLISTDSTSSYTASFTIPTSGTRIVTAKAYDDDGAVTTSNSVTIIASQIVDPTDTTIPVVNTFTIPATSASLVVPVSVFSAADNTGVTGYIITESATKPASTATGWTASAPTSYTFTTQGTKTLYAYAKDAANNVSNGKSAGVVVTLSPTTYTVTINKVGSGFITSSPTGVNCVLTVCTYTGTTGTPVTLTAAGITGTGATTFTGWSGACSGTGACNLSNTAAVTATFVTNPSTFSANDRVNVTVADTNVRSVPVGIIAGGVIGTQQPSIIGTIIGGPSYGLLSTVVHWWWNVNFDSGTDGWVTQSNLEDNNTPTVTATISASPTNVASDGASTIAWSSSNATSCSVTKAGSPWKSTVSGSSSSGNLTSNTTFTITCNGNGGPVTDSVTVSIQSNDPEYYPPVSRLVDWTPGVTVGVKGGIPNRTTVYKTLSPGASASSIADAIAGCPANQVVYLNEGTYNLGSEIRIRSKDGCTLRGAGQGKTILTGSPWAALLNLGEFPWITEWPSAVGVTGGAIEGSKQITLASTAGIVSGQPMYIEQANIANDIYGFGSGSANSAGRLRDGNNVLSQIVNVTSISGNTVSFDPPLNFSFNGSNVRAVGFNGKNGVKNFGVEDLTISGSTGGYGVWWQGCSNSWMKNVEITKWQTFGVEVQYCSNFEMRDSYFHDPAVFDWSKGYSLQFDQSNNSLIENNIFYKYQDGILFQGTSSGNVVAYNLLFRSYPAYNGVQIMLASIFGNHTPYPTKNLYEGNYAPSFHSDYYYGPSSKVTLLRNYFPATDPDATENRIAVNIDSHQWDYNVIGNILGSTGVSPSITAKLPNPDITVSYVNSTPVTSWVYGDKTTDNFSYTQNRIYRLGYPYIGNNSSSGSANPPSSSQLGHMDLSVQPGGSHEAILHGNWDAKTDGVVWKSGANTNIPDSYYLDSKPSWFGSLAWPPYDAATHSKSLTPEQMMKKIPAGYKFITGVNP